MANFTKKQIMEIKKNSSSKLEKKVINIILSHGSTSEMECFISDLLQHGCISGMVSKLIYYHDTVKFYKKYKSEIQKLLTSQLSEYGYNSPSEIFGNKWDNEDPFCEEDLNQNLLAWFSVEETTRIISDKLDMNL